MIKAIVLIETADKVKGFVNEVSKIECDVDLSSIDNHYIVDAKSILGVFSLDISKPLNILIHDDERNSKQYADFLEKFAK